MDILVLGGTGAMGTPLVQLLSERNRVWVTSRSSRVSDFPAIHYVQGDAMQKDFLQQIVSSQHWDAIVDFMNRKYSQFKEVLPFLMKSTSQYVFISSARVYNQSEEPITEETPRLLDTCSDSDYLKTDEYGLAKAREEDLVKKFGNNNYTIIRPSITYNDYRLQLGIMEKEDFVYRILHGRTLVFSRDLENKITTMTHGNDVARGIASIIGQPKALGETFHITSPKSLTWGEILNIYKKIIEEHLGESIKILWTDKTTNFKLSNQYYRIVYSRYFNRSFCNNKIGQFIDVDSFVSPEEGLTQCMRNFLLNPKFGKINWSLEGINNHATNENITNGEIKRIGDRIWYLLYRYDATLVVKIIKRILKLKK